MPSTPKTNGPVPRVRQSVGCPALPWLDLAIPLAWAALGFRLLPCQILRFPSAKTALGCLAGSRERQQNTEQEPPNLDLCSSRALRPGGTATAGAEGGGPGLVSHRQGPVTPSGGPARTSGLAPDARVQEARRTIHPAPAPNMALLWLRAAPCHISHGGRRTEVGGGRWEMAVGVLVGGVSNQMHVLLCIESIACISCISCTARQNVIS